MGIFVLLGTTGSIFAGEDCPKVLARAQDRASEFAGENRLAYYAHVFSLERTRYGGFTGKVVDGAFRRVQEASNPYRAGHYVVDDLADTTGRIRALLEFEDLVQSGHSLGRVAREVQHWIGSADRARYFYQHLAEFGERGPPILEYLLRKSQYFQRARRVRGPPSTFVTYSFEKETRKPEVSMMYRLPDYTDEKWLRLAPEARTWHLVNATHEEKRFLPASIIAPTVLKPRALGGYSQEHPHNGVGLLWEFAHHSYDFDPAHLLTQMRDVASALKETDSFHVHVVFELLKRYGHMPQFSVWVKQLNDYLYLMGMEEGLHRSRHAKLPEAAVSRWSLQGFVERFFPGIESDRLPSDLRHVDYYRYKFFGAAVRAKHYGDSRSPDYLRVAIELRDSTRRMDRWEGYLEKVGAAVTDRVWEERTERRDDEIELTLRVRRADINQLVANGLKRRMAKRLASLEPTLLIPLRDFENASYYDYRTHTFRSCPPDVARRVASARSLFVQDLIAIQRELLASRHEDEDIRTAIRWSLTEWAKRARVGGLFSGV